MNYEKDSKKFYIEQYIEMMVNELYLHQKHFPNSNLTLDSLFIYCKDEWVLSEKQKQYIYRKTKALLKSKYNLSSK